RRNPTVSGPRNERASSASALRLRTFGSDLRPFSLTGFFLHSRAHIGFTPFSDLTMLFPCARPIYPRASVPFLILEGSIIPRHELPRTMGLDRKSTRLNSSHEWI